MKSNNSGFTLLEVLIYIAIIAVVTSAIGAVFLSVANGQARADSAAEVNSNISFVLDKVGRDIAAANTINQPAAAGNSSATLALTIGATPINYCVVSGRLYRGSGGICNENSEPLTGQTVTVKSLTFTRLENINTILPKTVVSIQTVLSISYNSSNPSSQYSATKQLTSSLP